jgi:hypothetical protein
MSVRCVKKRSPHGLFVFGGEGVRLVGCRVISKAKAGVKYCNTLVSDSIVSLLRNRHFGLNARLASVSAYKKPRPAVREN